MADRAAWEAAVEAGDVWTQARLENPALAERAMVRVVDEDLGVEFVGAIARDSKKVDADLLDGATFTINRKAKTGAGEPSGSRSSRTPRGTPAPAPVDASAECAG